MKSITSVISNAKINACYKGIESKRAGLITVHRINENTFYVGIEYETEFQNNLFVETEKKLVYSIEDAHAFFAKFDPGTIEWLRLKLPSAKKKEDIS